MTEVVRPLPPMAPLWAGQHPWVWSLAYGLIGATEFAGMGVFLFGASPRASWLMGASFGALALVMARLFVNRPPWEPRWSRGFPLFDARRQPPWFFLVWPLGSILIVAPPVAQGVIDGRLWQIAWGVEFVVTGASSALWMRRYTLRVQAEDRAAQESLPNYPAPDPPPPPAPWVLSEGPPLPPGSVEMAQAGLSPALANPLRRLVARILDGGLILTIGSLFAGVFAGSDSGDRFALALLLSAVGFWMVLEVVLVAVLGQTPGKLLVGIRVSRTEEGDPPGWGRSILRWFAMAVLIVGYPFGLISYASVLWNKRRQTLYDKAAGTLVLNLHVERGGFRSQVTPS